MTAEHGRRTLGRRLGYFFGTAARGRGEIACLLRELEGIGTAAAVGGLPRDLLLAGNRAFSSDVDLVVDAPGHEVDRLAARHGGRPNRFGGHAIALHAWRVDVWSLERTWAHVNGHVEVRGLPDVLGTTFFDWDAVAYEVASRRLMAAPGYFGRLASRVVEVNLAANPNPFGNAVRAARHAARWDARFGPALAEHVARNLRDRGWGDFVAYEEASFGTRYLSGLDPSALGLGRSHGQASMHLPSMTA